MRPLICRDIPHVYGGGHYLECTMRDITHQVQSTLLRQFGDAPAKLIYEWDLQVKTYVSQMVQLYSPIRYDTLTSKSKSKPDIIIGIFEGVVRQPQNGAPPTLEPHDPKWCFKYVLPVRFIKRYKPGSGCRETHEQIQKKFSDKKDQSFIRAWRSYLFVPDTRFQKMLFVKGVSRTGKSTIFLDAFGPMFTTSLENGSLNSPLGKLRLDQFQTSRFNDTSHLWTLEHSPYNFASETKEAWDHAMEMLKLFVSGEPVVVRGPWRHAVSFSPITKLGFAMNLLPKMSGTMAEANRICLLLAENCHQDEVDLTVRDKVRCEASENFMEALAGLPEVLSMKQLPERGEHSMAENARLVRTFDVVQWCWDEMFEYYPGELAVSKVNLAIDGFLRDNVISGWKTEFLKRQIKDRFHIEVKQHNYTSINDRNTYWLGIRIKEHGVAQWEREPMVG
jgi:hypothetical protein